MIFEEKHLFVIDFHGFTSSWRTVKLWYTFFIPFILYYISYLSFDTFDTISENVLKFTTCEINRVRQQSSALAWGKKRLCDVKAIYQSKGHLWTSQIIKCQLITWYLTDYKENINWSQMAMKYQMHYWDMSAY